MARKNGSGPRQTFGAQVGNSHVRLFNEDCVAGMPRRLAARSVDVVVTSPPYNLGVKYSEYDDSGPRNTYLDWLDRWAESLGTVLSERGSLFLNLGSKPSDPWGPFEVALRLRKRFRLQNVIHWVKSIALEKRLMGEDVKVAGDLAVGHFKPINSARFLNDCHEYVFHFSKHGDVPLDRLSIGVPYQDKSNVTRWRSASNDVRCRGNTWFIPYETIRDRNGQRPHPATFPVELAKKCILLHGRDRTRLVLDPFLGLGHAGVAAVELGVEFAGFEVDDAYIRKAWERMGGVRQGVPAASGVSRR